MNKRLETEKATPPRGLAVGSSISLGPTSVSSFSVVLARAGAVFRVLVGAGSPFPVGTIFRVSLGSGSPFHVAAGFGGVFHVLRILLGAIFAIAAGLGGAFLGIAGVPAAAAGAAVFVERLRAVVSAFPASSPLLQRRLPGGGQAVAALAGLSEVAGRGAGEGMSAASEPALSGAAAATASGIAAGGGGVGSGVRGPAPSSGFGKFSGSAVPASRLLRTVSGLREVADAAVLQRPLPPGVAAGSAAGSMAATTARGPAARAAEARPGAAAALAVVRRILRRAGREE